MSDPAPILCLGCGRPQGERPRLNRLPSGELCPHCRDRVIEALPALLPRDEVDAEQPVSEGSHDAPGHLRLVRDEGGLMADFEPSEGPDRPLGA